MKLIYMIILPLSIFISCNSAKKAVQSENNKDTTEMENGIDDEKTANTNSQEFTILLQEAYGGLDKREQRVITSEKELQEVYNIINRFRRPGIPMPKVDFENAIVVALFMGEKTTGGYSTEVQSISMQGLNMIVNIKEYEPSPSDNVTTAICQPFCFVSIPKPKQDQKVVFKTL